MELKTEISSMIFHNDMVFFTKKKSNSNIVKDHCIISFIVVLPFPEYKKGGKRKHSKRA